MVKSNSINALFLYNPSDLNAEIPGGVQLCSNEFLNLIKQTITNVSFFEVQFNKSFWFRLMHRINLATYQSYLPKKYKSSLLKVIKDKDITHVFINKSELLKFSKIIKELDVINVPKIIILSHGNDSGDLLGELTNKNPKLTGIKMLTGIYKLGNALFLEAWYRKRYVDLVCTLSDEENAIEKWLGINNPLMIPRLINKNKKNHRSPNPLIVGFVGTLNHEPNLEGLNSLFETLDKFSPPFEVRIAGQPISIGKSLEKKYDFVKYLGALSNIQLEEEVKTWGFFINPIFYYSRGSSMKLATALELDIPVISTIAGARGYKWENGNMILTENNPHKFSEAVINSTSNSFDYNKYCLETLKIKESSLDIKDIAKTLQNALSKI